MGMQSYFTKYCWFLCLWDSRTAAKYYIHAEWPINVLPPTTIKLGFNKQYVKMLNRENSEDFK